MADETQSKTHQGVLLVLEELLRVIRDELCVDVALEPHIHRVYRLVENRICMAQGRDTLSSCSLTLCEAYPCAKN